MKAVTAAVASVIIMKAVTAAVTAAVASVIIMNAVTAELNLCSDPLITQLCNYRVIIRICMHQLLPQQRHSCVINGSLYGSACTNCCLSNDTAV